MCGLISKLLKCSRKTRATTLWFLLVTWVEVGFGFTNSVATECDCGFKAFGLISALLKCSDLTTGFMRKLKLIEKKIVAILIVSQVG